MKKLLTKALMLAAILGFTSAATFAKDYADLPKDHWAYKQIQILTDFNVVVGYPDGNYRPEQNVTRAEFATMVIKAFEQQKKSNNLQNLLTYLKKTGSTEWSKELLCLTF